MRWLRTIGLALLTVVAIGLAVPYIDATGYRERIQSALEQALQRKVTVGKVRFNLLTGPGFAVDDVTIGEDASIGIEPIAYVETLDARVRLTTLWTSRLSFSTLRLNNPSVNLAKGDNGVWNFQLLMRDAASNGGSATEPFPSIQVRSGRINFKFGDYKTIFYLSDADLDVNPVSSDRLDVRFSGQPARTDHAAGTFGRLLGRGVWKRSRDGNGQVDANLELERSGISDLARLLEGHAIGVHGIVASRMHVSGPPDKLKVTGQLHLEDVHRWDLLPAKSGGWDLKFQGSADLMAQQLEVQTDRKQEPDVPFLVRFRASEYLKNPKWAVVLEVKDAPLAPFVEVARHLGAVLPDGFSADGKVDGLIGYSLPGGVQGRFVMHDSAVRLQNAPPLNIRNAEVVIDGQEIRVGPSTVALSDGQTAEIQASYDADAGALAVDVTSRGLNVSELRTGSGRLLGAGAIPVLEACRQGTWRGTLSYARDASSAEWSGKFELHGARVDLDGMSEPLRIVSAVVEVDGPKVAVTQMKGRVGPMVFSGEYRQGRPGRPGKVKLDIPEADLATVEQLFLPTVKRESGILARLRIRNQQAPEWLRSRRLDAALTIGKLAAGEQVWSVSKVRALWDGAMLKLNGIEAQQDEAEATGQITVDLTGTLPRYSVEGSVADLPYRGGGLTLEGSAEARGTGIDVLANAHGSGTFSGDRVTLPPEGEFRAIAGNFELLPGQRLKLTAIQAVQGGDSYSGLGGTQTDGRMLLELTSGKRVVRVALAK